MQLQGIFLSLALFQSLGQALPTPQYAFHSSTTIHITNIILIESETMEKTQVPSPELTHPLPL